VELWEREFELDRLSSLLAGAADGNGCVVLVRGEAGIGKTTLVRRFLDSLGDDARVLIGWCDDLATPRELGPLWDMTLDEPGLVATIESGDRSRLYSAAVELIGHNDLPTVFVIEDVQWADGATLDLIKVLGRRIDRSRCLLLLTYRDEELDADHRLRLVFGDLPPHAVERLALSPLSDETIEQIAAAHRRDGALLIAESGGNPFYLSELLATEDHRVLEE
jgi:predicted ATPase